MLGLQDDDVLPRAVALQVLDLAYMEHDAFTIFVRIESYLKPLYAPGMARLRDVKEMSL